MGHCEVRNEIIACHLSSALSTTGLCSFYFFCILCFPFPSGKEGLPSYSRGCSHWVQGRKQVCSTSEPEKITNKTGLIFSQGRRCSSILTIRPSPAWVFSQLERRLNRIFSHFLFFPFFYYFCWCCKKKEGGNLSSRFFIQQLYFMTPKVKLSAL